MAERKIPQSNILTTRMFKLEASQTLNIDVGNNTNVISGLVWIMTAYNADCACYYISGYARTNVNYHHKKEIVAGSNISVDPTQTGFTITNSGANIIHVCTLLNELYPGTATFSVT